MMRLLITFFALALCLGCSDIPDPEITPVESLSFVNNGQDRKGYANEYLTDSLAVVIHDTYTGAPVPGILVSFEVTEGGGTVDHPERITDAQGRAYTRWKLGSSGTAQTVEAILTGESGKYLATIPFRATSFIPGTWNATSSQPESYFADMAADSVNGLTLAVGSSAIYSQGSRYFDWYMTSYLVGYYPRRILIDKNLTFWVSTWYGQLFKSTNHGYTWQECAKPWQDYSNYYYIQLTGDGYIWVSAPGRPMRCSRDGGFSWQEANTGLSEGELLGDIFRLSDGTLFFLSLNMHLNKSVDDGNSWTTLPSPPYSLKLYVTDKDELIMMNQEGALPIYKSTDRGEHFTRKHAVYPAFTTLMDHMVHKWGNDYFILVPGYGVLRTRDFEEFEDYWLNANVNDMFMDDEGVLIARVLNGQQVHYKDNR
jgi:hypothetical protein